LFVLVRILVFICSFFLNVRQLLMNWIKIIKLQTFPTLILSLLQLFSFLFGFLLLAYYLIFKSLLSYIKRPLAWIISHDEVNMVLNIIFKSDNNIADKYNFLVWYAFILLALIFISILVWNCQGAKTQEYWLSLNELCRCISLSWLFYWKLKLMEKWLIM
jgi:hypothetical protein